jgi:hypothetical protein
MIQSLRHCDPVSGEAIPRVRSEYFIAWGLPRQYIPRNAGHFLAMTIITLPTSSTLLWSVRGFGNE